MRLFVLRVSYFIQTYILFIFNILFIIKLNIIKLINEIIIILIILSNIGIIGAILNIELKSVSPNINIIVNMIESTILNIENGNLVSSPFLVLESVNNKIIPHRPVDMTHKLENCSSGIIPNLFNIDSANIFIATVSPVGNAFDITFFKKYPFILSLFGSNASINDGIPIVTTLIKLNCIGTNGYDSPINKNISASTVEYIVFTKNNDADL